MCGTSVEGVVITVDDVGRTHLVDHFAGQSISLSACCSVVLRMQLIVQI